MSSKYMDELIKELGNKILDTRNLQSLHQLQYKMEIRPFCGLDQCYDLERFVFHIIKPHQREAVIEHIRSLSQDKRTTPHIYTTQIYIQSIHQNTGKLLSTQDIPYLTVLSSFKERDEPIYRYRNRATVPNSVVSGLDSYKSDDKINSLASLELDHDEQAVASQYFRTIMNYGILFPHFMPLWISEVSPMAILLGQRLQERATRDKTFQWIGCLLDNSLSHLSLKDAKTLQSHKIYVFHNDQELMRLLADLLSTHSQLV